MRVLELGDVHPEEAVFTEPPPEAAAGMEELVTQLVGILDGEAEVWPAGSSPRRRPWLCP